MEEPVVNVFGEGGAKIRCMRHLMWRPVGQLVVAVIHPTRVDRADEEGSDVLRPRHQNLCVSRSNTCSGRLYA
jgi:hypothetical protein